MKTSRISAAIVSTLALTATGHAYAEPVATEGATVRLDTVQKMWVAGDDIGPKQNGLARVGKNTGAGIMDPNFAFDTTAAARAKFGEEVLLGTVYTRSANTENPNSDNSYMEGGFALAKLTAKGLELGAAIDLPQLNGDRAFMRPLIAFTPKYAVLVAASEDNNANNGNPRPVMFLVDKTTGQLAKIANNTRGNNINKPTDLIAQALQDGINVPNANNQRSPHTITPITDNSFLVGMQYNNQAQESFRVTVSEDGGVKMNWVVRYTPQNNAVHSRPAVAYTPGAKEAYMTAILCNNQPADIGLLLTKLDIDTGKPITQKKIVSSQPNQNKYVAEPSIADLGDTVAIGYALSAKARANRDGNNGHAGGANVSQLALYKKADLNQVGETLVAPANYQRHAHIFATQYGPNAEKAVAVISGSSTGTGKGLVQMIPLKADGTLGVKDPLKMYTVSTYSDVANLQARGKRNPNNQAKGFINGLGDVPNPGFDKPGGFYPEVKTFSLSAVTGYSSAAARDVGKRESLWLSLVPSTWKEGLKTAPGVPNENAGNGPAPRTADPATDPAGTAGANNEDNVLDGTEATRPGEGAGGNARGPQFGGESESGCNVSHSSSTSGGLSAFALALAGVLVLVRRNKKSEES